MPWLGKGLGDCTVTPGALAPGHSKLFPPMSGSFLPVLSCPAQLFQGDGSLAPGLYLLIPGSSLLGRDLTRFDAQQHNLPNALALCPPYQLQSWGCGLLPCLAPLADLGSQQANEEFTKGSVQKKTRDPDGSRHLTLVGGQEGGARALPSRTFFHITLNLSWRIWKVGAMIQTSQILDRDPEKTEKEGFTKCSSHVGL